MWPSKRARDTSPNESPAPRRREPTWMGSCTIMPMIPTAWHSSVCCKVCRLYEDVCDLYLYRLVRDGRGHFSKSLLVSCRESSHGFTEKGGAVIFLVFQSICGSDEAGNHDPLAGSDSASIFIFFHPKARHICYNNSNIVKF